MQHYPTGTLTRGRVKTLSQQQRSTTSTKNFYVLHFSQIPQNNTRLKLSYKFGELNSWFRAIWEGRRKFQDLSSISRTFVGLSVNDVSNFFSREYTCKSCFPQITRSTQIGFKSSISRPCDLEIWWKTPKNNKAPLLYYIKLEFAYHFRSIRKFKLKIQSGNGQFGSKWTILLAVWPSNLTYDLEKQ